MRLTHELHVHLYGSLTAEMLWELGKDRHFDEARIAWYKQEYAKAYGKVSRVEDFWRVDDGPALLADEYVFREKGSFAKFQASINLPIALFPLSTSEAPLLHKAAQMHADEGLEYVEYRVFLPPYFSSQDQWAYLSLMANEAHLIEKHYAGAFTVRLLLSISRDDQQTHTLYATVRKWMTAHPDAAIYVSGLDFCANECGHPPKRKKNFMAQLRRDNLANPMSALAVLYHVGETFEHLTPQSALRWIIDAQLMQCHRLGHAVALGLSSDLLQSRHFSESKEERLDHLDWLLEHERELQSFGHTIERSEVLHHKQRLLDGDHHVCSVLFDVDECKEFDSLQCAAVRWLSAMNAVIETCPTSNLLISNLPGYEHVPALHFLRDESLRVCIGADDPGIFATTITKEFEHCANAGIRTDRLANVATVQKMFMADILSGRKT